MLVERADRLEPAAEAQDLPVLVAPRRILLHERGVGGWKPLASSEVRRLLELSHEPQFREPSDEIGVFVFLASSRSGMVIPMVAPNRSGLLMACGEGIEGSSLMRAGPLRRPQGSGLSRNGPTPASDPVRGSASHTIMSKEFLTDIVVKVATVTSKGQVTLPASVRKRLGLREGSRIVFLEAGPEVRVLREEDLERSFAVFDRRRRELRLTRSRMRALLDAARDRLRKEPRARRD